VAVPFYISPAALERSTLLWCGVIAVWGYHSDVCTVTSLWLRFPSPEWSMTLAIISCLSCSVRGLVGSFVHFLSDLFIGEFREFFLYSTTGPLSHLWFAYILSKSAVHLLSSSQGLSQTSLKFWWGWLYQFFPFMHHVFSVKSQKFLPNRRTWRFYSAFS
jgi:hypothetical protein